MAISKRRVSLRIRFTVLVSCLLLLTSAVIAFFLVRNAQATDIRNINQGNRAFAALSAPQIGNTYGIYKDSGSIKIKQQIQNFTSLDSNIINVAVIKLDGQPAFQTNPAVGTQSLASGQFFDNQYTSNAEGLITQVVVPYIDANGQHPYSIAYRVDPAVLAKDNARQIRGIIMFSLLGLALTAVVLYEFMTRFFISPIERISRQSLIISQGNYDQSIKVARNDELGDLAGSVNDMSDKLKTDIAKLQEVDALKNEFIAITSHNLRTPLSIIDGSLEVLGLNELDDNVKQPLEGIRHSATQLANFAEDMLTIAMIEGGQSAARLELASLESLVTPLRQQFDSIAATKGVQLNWEIMSPATKVAVSVKYLQGTLKNLLDNAIKFTDKNGSVNCRLEVISDQFKISIQDTGVGISVEEQAKLFTKFHRGTSTMEYNYTGTGIGLYVAKLMTEAQHGNIQVVSEPGKGSTFTVIIPQPITQDNG